MARKTIVQITDDLDGSANADTVRFSLQGVEYEIDLSKKNRAVFEKVLKPYVEAGTKVSRNGTRKKGAAGGSRDLASIRSWANDNGIRVSDRGRVPQSVVAQYDDAHK